MVQTIGKITLKVFMIINNNTNIPQESFINLFSEIVYDQSQIAQNSLDIWDAYQIDNITRGSNNKLPTFIYRPTQEDTLERLAKLFYQSDRLWWITLIVNNVEDPYTFIDDVVNKKLNNGVINILKVQYISSIISEMKRIKAINDDKNVKLGR
jgi:hypothetical protein